MSIDIYSEKVAEASALIREFAKQEYFEYFKGNPEQALEAFCVMMDSVRAERASRIAELEAQVAELRADREKMWKARFMISQALHNVMVGNQSAWIEWQHGAGAEEAMNWIHNGLVGPGLIPKDCHAITAQAWFDANQDDRYEIPPAPALPAAPVEEQGAKK